jgi:hypothetical protein
MPGFLAKGSVMFRRNDKTYVIGDEAIDKILSDPAQPLGQIARILPDAATVLDIGAGNGMLGRVLKVRESGSPLMPLSRVNLPQSWPNLFIARFIRGMHRIILKYFGRLNMITSYWRM